MYVFVLTLWARLSTTDHLLLRYFVQDDYTVLIVDKSN